MTDWPKTEPVRTEIPFGFNEKAPLHAISSTEESIATVELRDTNGALLVRLHNDLVTGKVMAVLPRGVSAYAELFVDG